MESKKCNQCDKEKHIVEFSVNIKTNKLKNRCKDCDIYWANYYSKEKRKIIKRSRTHQVAHKEDRKMYLKKYGEINKKELSEKKKIQGQIYRENNKDKILKKNKIYRDNNRDRINLANKIYKEKNKIKERKYARVYVSKKRKTDFLYKFKHNTRVLMLRYFKSTSFKKSKKTEEILGCTIEQFKLYIENKFETWMNWGNRGMFDGKTLKLGWDIDHIIPLATAKTVEDVVRLNHYTNLRPLDSYINRIVKRDKLVY